MIGVRRETDLDPLLIEHLSPLLDPEPLARYCVGRVRHERDQIDGTPTIVRAKAHPCA